MLNLTRLVPLVAFSLTLAACQKSPRLTDPPAVTTRPGQTFTALDLQPLREGTWLFEVTEGPRTGRELTATIQSDGPNRWRYELEDTRVVFLEVNADGGIVVPREQDLEENVEVTYTPALVMLPGKFTVGEPHKDECGVAITNLKTGEIRDRGRCAYTRELIGPAAGMPNAWLVRGTRHLDLGLATADIVIETTYIPGQGTETERVEQKTRPLGLFTIKKVEALKLRR